MFAFTSYQKSQKFSSHFCSLFKLATLTQEGMALLSKDLALQLNLIKSKVVMWAKVSQCMSPYKKLRIGILQIEVGG